MKKRLLGLLLGIMLVFGCVGCGAESTTTEPTETATETITEESTTEQAEEASATSEETAEPTPEATEEPSEETTVETEPETTEPMETVEPEPTEEPTPEPQAIYTYTDMSATMYAQQTVNVRDLPDTNGNKIGSLSTNDEITISAKCNETGWYQFEYNGNVAYVSNKYVGENKIEIQQTPADNSGGESAAGTGSTSGAFNEADFPTPYAIINKGGLNVYYVMGPDPDMNYNASEQCIAAVGANLGIEMEYHGAGTYYIFNAEGSKGIPNANGVTGLFFPYYKAANGEWLGESPETQMQVF